jgi:hypothetical protein
VNFARKISFAAALVSASAISAGSLSAQTSTPDVINACYVQGSGTLYVTGLEGAPEDCRALNSTAQPHKPISWGGASGLVAVQGTVGAVGPMGPQGETGATGATGAVGPTGPQGIQGDKGDKGDKGDQGIQGIQGVTGDKGEKGDRGLQGVQGIQGIQGIPGLSGLQRISVTANLDVANVVCPAGKKILSGGYIAPSNGSVLVQQSYPSADDTWTVVVKNTGNARTSFQAWAVCATVE